MSAKHTPGPWVLVRDTDGSPIAIEPPNGGLSVECDCSGCHDYPRQYLEIVTCDSHVYGPALQDARLIVASPEMRDLLERAKEVLDNYADVVDDCDGSKANPALSLCSDIDVLLAKIDGVRL